MKSLSLALCSLVMLYASLFAGYAAAQQATLSKDSALFAEPSPKAAVITELTQGTAVEVMGKQGVLFNVKTGAGAGWVYSFNVHFGGSGQAAPSGSGLGSLLGRPKPSVTATIGIRGLEAEDLKRATFDGEQLGLLDQYATPKQEAERTARASGLSAVRIEYLAQ